ncbi:hypothetical protein DUI87_21409 [Hirundo rustica rustica]|uniref:Uncharacterized protein n=1 Tax=Hirundo rustica rustica TaxID=333673 RepID=A0A3M0JMG9_HIRRU|nr:hypothetical protein DUI87_21409 [Hirundo rustica rustica]
MVAGLSRGSSITGLAERGGRCRFPKDRHSKGWVFLWLDEDDAQLSGESQHPNLRGGNCLRWFCGDEGAAAGPGIPNSNGLMSVCDSLIAQPLVVQDVHPPPPEFFVLPEDANPFFPA